MGMMIFYPDKEHYAQCEKELVVGATVYMPEYRSIRTGKVTERFRGYLANNGYPIRDEKKEGFVYIASFGSGILDEEEKIDNLKNQVKNLENELSA